MSNFCPNCGIKLTDKESFCPNCGTKLFVQNEQFVTDECFKQKAAKGSIALEIKNDIFETTKNFLVEVFFWKGRIGRKYFFIRMLIFNILSILSAISLDSSGTTMIGKYLAVISLIPLFFFSIATSIRRLHDLNHSGAWIILSCVPILQFVLLAYLLLFPGSKGVNDYGKPDIKQSVKDSVLSFCKTYLNELPDMGANALKDDVNAGLIHIIEKNNNDKGIKIRMNLDAHTLRDEALLLLAEAIFAVVTSGKYHKDRGKLNTNGGYLIKVYIGIVNDLLNRGIVTKEKHDKNIYLLMKGIEEAG